MKNNSLGIFKVIAWIVAVYHLILGAVTIFASPDIIEQVVKIYNVSPELSPQFLYLAKFIAAYGVAFGVMMAFVAYNPHKYYAIAWGAIVLFAIRIFERFFYFDLLSESFGTTMAQNLMTVITIGVLGAGLFFFMPRGKKDSNERQQH